MSFGAACAAVAGCVLALSSVSPAEYVAPPGYVAKPVAAEIKQVTYLISNGNLCQAWSVIEFDKEEMVHPLFGYYIEYRHVASGQLTYGYRKPPFDSFGPDVAPPAGKYWKSLSGNVGLTCALAAQYASDDWSDPRVVAYVPASPVGIDVADASPRSLSVFLPDATNAATLPTLDWAATRSVNGVAADGVTLLLVRASYRGALEDTDGTIRLRVSDTEHGADPGSLWQPSNRVLVDDGAFLDDQSVPASTTAIVGALTQDPNDAAALVAFFLYRSPRNFDGASGTGELQKRKITFQADVPAAGGGEILDSKSVDLDVVRPLVFLQHGTFDSPSGWTQSPLFTETGNELRSPAYTGFSAEFPFQTDRGDFSWEQGAAGRLVDTAPLAWDTLSRKLDNWRRVTGYAGTQADVVCHSYGGVVMRWAAQTQLGGPLSQDTGHNFRNETNWGHGAFHKLITIASTHRGSAVSNQLADLNANGLKPGLIRLVATVQASWIDRGGVEDQMVVSPVLRQLAETRVRGHLIAGSGLAEFNRDYASRLRALWFADRLGGPFKSLGPLSGPDGSPYWDRFRMASNYGFNLGQTLADDTTQDPNYDLTVSSFSSKAGIVAPAQFVTTPLILGIVAGRNDLDGHFTHGDEIAFGSADYLPGTAVAKRVAFLLRQPAEGDFFGHFPATASVPLTATELAFSDPSRFDPHWLYLKATGLPPGVGASLRPELGRARAALEAPAAVPVMVVEPASTTVTPGQTLQVTVSWPGADVASGFLTWPGAQAGVGAGGLLGPEDLSKAIVVPDRSPGPFSLLAVVTSSAGETSVARVDLEVVDATPYLELRAEPAVLTLRSARPGAVNVYGRLDQDRWSRLDTSPRLHLESGDPAVVAVEDGRLQPVAAGTTTVTATYDGELPTPIAVTVAFDPTTTTTTTTLAQSTTTTSVATTSTITTSTTLPPSEGCAAVRGFAGARCVCDRGIAPASCATDRIPAAVSRGFQKACASMNRAAELSPATKRNKVRALLRSAAGSVKKSRAALVKLRKKGKLSPECGATIAGTIEDLGVRVSGLAQGG